MNTISPAEFKILRAQIEKSKKSKYKANGHYDTDGIYWPSDKEERKWHEFKLLEKNGEIKNLRRQISFKLHGKNGSFICKYICDIIFEKSKTGETIHLDVKGMETKEFRLKKKLFEDEYKVKLYCI